MWASDGVEIMGSWSSDGWEFLSYLRNRTYCPISYSHLEAVNELFSREILSDLRISDLFPPVRFSNLREKGFILTDEIIANENK
jgi:hypothetical protein